MVGRIFVAAMGLAGALTAPAFAKDEPMPVLPCLIEGQLRVASSATLAGFETLESCTPAKIIVAPANVSEYPTVRDIRFTPPRSPLMRAILTREDDTSVVRIKPQAYEAPVDGDFGVGDLGTNGLGTNGDVSIGAIMAMRPVSYSTPFDDMIGRVAERHRIDPLLLHAVIHQESRYRVNATSHVGARGLMQLMPGTARDLGVASGAIAHPESNVDAGARYLRQLHGRFNDFSLTLAAYNAGPGAVLKYGNRIPPYAETRAYVQKVMAHYRRLLSEQQVASR